MWLRYIIIKVKDIKRAKEFYTRLLKMQPSKEEGDRMVVFNLDNIKVGLYNPLTDGEVLQDSDFGTNYRAAFGVNDIELECERISEFAEVVGRKKVDHHDWVEFKDSEGNMLEIHKI